MKPLQPPPRLLRAIARELREVKNPRVQAWLEAMRALPVPRKRATFPHTSVVATYREQRLCGYEVWRHLDVARNDPSRKKARLWFGCTRHGGRRRTLQLAYYSAAAIAKMSNFELREWWNEYRAARAAGRPVTNLWRSEERFVDSLDVKERQSLFCAMRRAS